MVNDIRMVAISKGHGVEKIRAAYHAGIREFGENRIHEALPKLEELEAFEDIRWHMVGHIQSRKAKLVIPAFDIVHSVDRMKIAQRLNRFAGESGLTFPVLLECNVSGELTKYGWNLQDEEAWSEVLPEFDQLVKMENLAVLGLMTMAPWVSDERILRSCFGKLRELASFLATNLPGEWRELSMGMTDDFEFAIEEGATIIRIGRAIFGERSQ
jgi:pyridoxal phosphate enzyme (YggS family)